MKKKTLLIFSDDPLYFDGESYMTENPIVELYHELTKYFDIALSGPTKKGTKGELRGYVKVQKSIICKDRPFYGSAPEFLKRFPFIIIPTMVSILKNVKSADIVMLRLPSPPSIFVYIYAKMQRKPVIVYVSGDMFALLKYKGAKRIVILLIFNFFFWLTRYMARNTLVFVNGDELLQRLKTDSNTCVNFVPSIIKQKDIFKRKAIFSGKDLQAVFVGRLVKEKGILRLFKSIAELKEKGISVRLNVVGDGPQKQELLRAAKNMEIGDVVEFSGSVPFGKPLFNIYRKADVLVSPSSSEGLPKTLFEAMAFGVLIIATKVGGIPDLIRRWKVGILIDVGSKKPIVAAFERILKDKKLRENFILNGYRFIENHTMEKQAVLFANTVAQYIEKS